MKKILTLTALLALSTSAFAGFTSSNSSNQQGFQSKTTTVAQALQASDDTIVTLTGKITGRVGNDDDEFMFQDNTGSIKIDVDDSAWKGQEVSEKDTITIQGKVDSEFGRKNDIDVFYLQKH